jgi:hypothetical protein
MQSLQGKREKKEGTRDFLPFSAGFYGICPKIDIFPLGSVASPQIDSCGSAEVSAQKLVRLCLIDQFLPIVC